MEQRRKTILIIEDEPTHQDLFQYILEKSYDILFADSYDEGLIAMHVNTVDLILLDIKLKGRKNGLLLCERLRSNPNWDSIPIIAVTAYAFNKDRNRCLDAGCNGYLSKPVEAITLLNTVNNFLNTRKNPTMKNRYLFFTHQVNESSKVNQ